MGLTTSNDLLKKIHSLVYLDTLVLVSFRSSEVDNQEWPSQPISACLPCHHGLYHSLPATVACMSWPSLSRRLYAYNPWARINSFFWFVWHSATAKITIANAESDANKWVHCCEQLVSALSATLISHILIFLINCLSCMSWGSTCFSLFLCKAWKINCLSCVFWGATCFSICV